MRDTLLRLLDLDGSDFLSQSYLSLLNRPIDRDGLTNYMRHLESGESKISIIFSINASAEHLSRNFEEYARINRLLCDISLAPSPATEGFLPTFLDVLCSAPQQFVGSAISFVFGRPPFPDETRAYSIRFEECRDRIRILSDLNGIGLRYRSEPTFHQRLKAAIADLRRGMFPIATSVQELLSLDDLSFVDCCYKTLLRRPPDIDGFSGHLRRFRSGQTKLGIVRAIANSPEGRAKGASLPGLNRRLLLYGTANLRLLRPVATFFPNIELEGGNAGLARAALRALKRSERHLP